MQRVDRTESAQGKNERLPTLLPLLLETADLLDRAGSHGMLLFAVSASIATLRAAHKPAGLPVGDRAPSLCGHDSSDRAWKKWKPAGSPAMAMDALGHGGHSVHHEQCHSAF